MSAAGLLTVCAVYAGAFIAFGVWQRARRFRRYRAKVGLRLDELVALLPAHLRDRTYTYYRIAPSSDGHIAVSLVYEVDYIFRGNPPNVGLEFDAETGALVAIHEGGIGLGIK